VTSIRRKIAAFDAAARERMNDESFGQASDAFDHILPPELMERYFQEQVIPALREYAERCHGSRHCTIGLVTDMRLPLDWLDQIGCAWPVGLAIRLSRKEGIIGVPDANDPYVAVVYVEHRQRAYAVTKMWGSEVAWLPLGGRDLGHDALLERVHDFAVGLDRWERRHPPLRGLDPYPRFSAAA
jgi:hypothetical protein